MLHILMGCATPMTFIDGVMTGNSHHLAQQAGRECMTYQLTEASSSKLTASTGKQQPNSQLLTNFECCQLIHNMLAAGAMAMSCWLWEQKAKTSRQVSILSWCISQ